MKQMKLKILLKLIVILMFTFTSSRSQSNKADMIVGDWMDSKKETLVHCYKRDGKFFETSVV